MSNGESVVKVASDFENGHDGYFDFNTQVMDYDFYAVPSGSGLDIEDPTRPDAAWKEDATGTQTVTYTVSDLTGYWSGLGYTVPDPAPTAQYEYTIVAAPVLESLSASGSWTNPQQPGEAVDPTGLTFTATYNNGDTATVTPQSYDPEYWEGTGTQTCTFSYTENGVTVTCDVEAEVAVVRTLVGITISNLPEEQFTGHAPNLEYANIEAEYDNGDRESLGSPDEVSPNTWDATGNPNNLGQQELTVTYTIDGETASGSENVTVHRPETNLSLAVGSAGHVYFDMSAAEFAESWKGATDVAQNGATAGDHIALYLPDSYYQDGTKYPTSQLMTDVAAYGAVLSETGEPGTAGYVPVWGYSKNTDLEDSYFAASIDGTGTASTSETVHILIGTAANNITAGEGWSLSDFSSSGLRHIVVTLTV